VGDRLIVLVYCNYNHALMIPAPPISHSCETEDTRGILQSANGPPAGTGDLPGPAAAGVAGGTHSGLPVVSRPEP
jgi:hypothetical protein